MILKNKDNRAEDVRELESLLAQDLTEEQRFSVDRELKSLLSGVKGEKDSAYYIDFGCKSSQNRVVIHDLRLEHLGLSAQIDHLIINRVLEFYVLETKNFSYGMKITDNGEFMAKYGKSYHGIESPIEQNKRHIELLKRVLDARDILPKRLGITLTPSFKNYVLVAPGANIYRPVKSKFDSTPVVKADAFLSQIDKEIDDTPVADTLLSLAKIVSRDTLIEIAKRVIKLHSPAKPINYAEKFGITKKVCARCGGKVSEKVIEFCVSNNKRFGGKVLCYNCQRVN